MSFILLLKALTLVLVVEGLILLLLPKRWRHLAEHIRKLDDHQIRQMGLVALGIGLAGLWIINLWVT
jgi:uncharacterized protein YjeT (DUF2065 family)